MVLYFGENGVLDRGIPHGYEDLSSYPALREADEQALILKNAYELPTRSVFEDIRFIFLPRYWALAHSERNAAGKL